MLVTNEISFRTLRQNIINGLSRAEVLTGHLLLILLISLYCLFLLFAVGFAMGFTHSTAQGADAIFGNMAYMGASFLQTFSYLLAALLVGLFFQRAGISIGLLILYTFIVGPIIAYLTGDLLDLFVPMRPNFDMIQFPLWDFVEMFGMGEGQKAVELKHVAATIVHSAVDVGLIYLILKKRDL